MSLRAAPGLAATASVLLFLGPNAQAQQQDLSAEEVRNYIEQIQKDATAIMEAQDYRKIIEWTQSNIAEGAVFQVGVSLARGEQQTGFASMSLKREDILRIGGVFAGAFQQQGIDDYSLKAEVSDIVPLGPQAATAQVKWTESFKIDVGGQERGDGQAPAGESFSVKSVADCNHLLQRKKEQLVIGLTSCVAEMHY